MSCTNTLANQTNNVEGMRYTHAGQICQLDQQQPVKQHPQIGSWVAAPGHEFKPFVEAGLRAAAS